MLNYPIVVKPDIAQKVIDTYEPKGRFITYSKEFWVAIDNRTGDAWTEDFNTFYEALKWLK